MESDRQSEHEGFQIRLGASMIDGMILQAVALPFVLIVARNIVTALFYALLVPCTDGNNGVRTCHENLAVTAARC